MVIFNVRTSQKNKLSLSWLSCNLSITRCVHSLVIIAALKKIKKPEQHTSIHYIVKWFDSSLVQGSGDDDWESVKLFCFVSYLTACSIFHRSLSFILIVTSFILIVSACCLSISTVLFQTHSLILK